MAAWQFSTFTPYQQSADGGTFLPIADIGSVTRVQTRVGFSVANGDEEVAAGDLHLERLSGVDWIAVSTWKNVQPTYATIEQGEPVIHVGDVVTDGIPASAVPVTFRYLLEYTDGDWASTPWTIDAVAADLEHREMDLDLESRTLTAGVPSRALTAEVEEKQTTATASLPSRSLTAELPSRTLTAGASR